ncbi:type IX secretion system periplasmic lipoprotein PorW/SprE [Rufibacter psychrotolerans]|uniref:type IX secretion system periplasmic lipoprotein PorW/SprE n=1 Tax=Rufibacter psychrotolerans TaxID=2812556 RepID=UPI0019679B4F|nr:tetratricopeptide repeat protein [Rufibacter sp. SYSU D00308]
MKLTRFLLLILILSTLAGCSADKPLGKLYRNINARFNGYFLAWQKMEEIEKRLAAATVNDYNRILDILPPVDTTTLKTLAPDLDEVIKRASFPIVRHPKSRWIDDCYVLIGKARYYQGEDAEAMKTFRFVQTTSPDRHARHEAMIWMMRLYLRQKEYDNAISISEQFRKERMNEENGRELLLTRAQLASIQNNLPLVIENLEKAIPFAHERDQEARLRFILGQLYQTTNQDTKAYEQFARVLKKRPPYELGFYANLNLAQVTELKDEADQEKVKSFLYKLAKDQKNTEYLDKIYYDLAKLELREKKYPEALNLLQKSTGASTTNTVQKAYSYLLSGQIHYENLQQYGLAQAYYDSTLQLLPPTTLGYEELADRRTVLTAFTQQLEIIRTEDSLQALAQLSEAERAQRVAQQITREREQEQAAATALAAANARPTTPTTQTGTLPIGGAGTQGSAWYFDNPVALAGARNDFLRTWGDRPLQDNWRRITAISGGTNLTAGTTTATTVDSAALAAAAAQKQQAYLAAIPVTPEQRQASDKRLEEALFTLGNIYQQRLREPEKAAQTFKRLLERFPNSTHASEAYYSLYVMAQGLQQTDQAAGYAKALKERFPNSKYSKLIDQPDFLRTYSAENLAAHALYDSAYVLYEQEEYPQTLAVLAALSQKYPQNDIPDQIAFLRALVTGRTQSPVVFRNAMEQFVIQFPESPLLPKAREFMNLYARYESGDLAKAPVVSAPYVPKEEVPTYKAERSQPHHFVIVHTGDSTALRQLITAYGTYNNRFHPKKQLTIEPQPFGDSTTLLLIKSLPDYKAAEQYARLQTARSSPLATLKGPKFATFVITEANLTLLRKLGDIAQYVAFFEKNYQ